VGFLLLQVELLEELYSMLMRLMSGLKMEKQLF
jgi:hypothetical protein